MSDPLDVIFVTGDEAAELKRTDTARKLATYLERMPAELRGLFAEKFQRIDRAELAQLRSDLKAAQERSAQLEAVTAFQARQLEEAKVLIQIINQKVYLKRDLQVEVNHWLSANPAPSAEAQL